MKKIKYLDNLIKKERKKYKNEKHEGDRLFELIHLRDKRGETELILYDYKIEEKNIDVLEESGYSVTVEDGKTTITWD